MTSGERRMEHLMGLREEALLEMAAAEAEMAQPRSRIERLESEQRLGAAPTPSTRSRRAPPPPRRKPG